MKIAGMGYAILRVTASQLRELHTVPPDVVFEKTCEACGRQWERFDPSWVHDEHPFYFRIRHRYLPRSGDRAPLMVFTLHELLKQHADVTQTEREMAGERLADHPQMAGSWVDDELLGNELFPIGTRVRLVRQRAHVLPGKLGTVIEPYSTTFITVHWDPPAFEGDATDAVREPQRWLEVVA